MTYSLKNDGLGVEITAYDDFIKPQFPSYEVFWQKFVVPLTRRPADKQLKTDADLVLIGKGPAEICIAQLHYTVLLQLDRSRRLLCASRFGLDHLVFGLSALVGAQDCAFELLQRFTNPAAYDPWLSHQKKGHGRKGSKEAQKDWRDQNRHPLQDIRDYRNSLVHGRTPPVIGFSQVFLVPKIGKETAYIDWRLVTAVANPPRADFEHPKIIMTSALDRTVAYFESTWNSKLLPNI